MTKKTYTGCRNLKFGGPFYFLQYFLRAPRRKGEGKKEEYEDDMGYREEPMDGDVPEQTQVPEREKKQETYKREQPKVGRNDPCPCGSGKKYKHCCGRNQ